MRIPVIALGLFLIIMAALPWIGRLWVLYEDYASWVLGK